MKKQKEFETAIKQKEAQNLKELTAKIDQKDKEDKEKQVKLLADYQKSAKDELKKEILKKEVFDRMELDKKIE